MKKLLCILSVMFYAVTAAASVETIIIVSPYIPGNSGQNTLLGVLSKANANQNRYNFILENKPGAQGLLALHYTQANSNNRVALITAGSIELFDIGKVKFQDWFAIHGIGDACWAVATNWSADESQGLKSVKAPEGTKNLIIGAVGVGSISHLTGLEMAGRLGLEPITVVFKSGTESVLNLVSDQGVNIAIDSVQIVENMKLKNPKIRIVATICNQRNPMVPHVPTLIEQGFTNVPPVFNIILAHSSMPDSKRQDIGNVLDQATKDVGFDRIFALSGFRPAVAQKMSAQEFFNLRVGQLLSLRKKYSKEINESK